MQVSSASHRRHDVGGAGVTAARGNSGTDAVSAVAHWDSSGGVGESSTIFQQHCGKLLINQYSNPSLSKWRSCTF